MSTSHLDLFRSEALAAASQSRTGRPIAALPVSWFMLTLSFAGAFALFVIFLTTATFTRKEAATGLIGSANGEVRVVSPLNGAVAKLFVDDGDHVAKGQLLLTVSTSMKGVGGELIDKAIIEGIDEQLANLDRRLQALSSDATLESRALPGQLTALNGQMSAAINQRAAARDRLKLAKDAFARIQPVAAKGFISGEALRRRQEEVILLTQSIADADGTIARLGGEIDLIRSSFARHPYKLVQEQEALRALINKARSDRKAAIENRGFSIVAPTEGTVTALQITSGQSILQARPLLAITTPAPATYVELFVPSRAIGFLKKGQEVRVRYDAFPYQRFGAATGRVASISATVLRPEEVEAAIRLDQPVYRVVVVMNKNYVGAYGKRFPLRSGLSLTADVVLDKQTFAEWLLEPLVALKGRLQ